MSKGGDKQQEQDDGSKVWRRNTMYVGYISTVITTVNVCANETDAIYKNLGFGSNAVGLQYTWEGLTVCHLRICVTDE